nr:PilN domain-containing protein [Fibrobacter succinogenes]
MFRRAFKACVGILLATLLVTFAFWGGVSWYAAESETQIAAFEKNIESRKELERVWKKLEADKAGTEKFLSHRSRVATSLSIIAADLPANSWISHWAVRGSHLSLQGYSASSEEVSKFLLTLESEKKLVNVRLRTTEKTTFKRKPVVKFDLGLEVVP